MKTPGKDISGSPHPRLSGCSLRRRLRARGRAWRSGRGGVVRVLQLLVKARRWRAGGRARRGAAALALALLLLHAPVLEPDLHLSLVELQRGGDLDAPRPRQVLAEVELLLQLRQLTCAEVGADCAAVRAGQAEVRHLDWIKGRQTKMRLLISQI